VANNPLRYTDQLGLCAPGDVPCKNAQRVAGLPPDPPARGPIKPGCLLGCLAVKPALGQGAVIAAGKAVPAMSRSSFSVVRGAGSVTAIGTRILGSRLGIIGSVAAAVDFCMDYCSDDPKPDDPNYCKVP
jgi:hypothetical protein